MKKNRLVLLLGFVVLLAGCEPKNSSDSDEAASESLVIPKVVESFDVGEGVYVRSLAFEKDSNALWIGSSLGVLEIDLDSQEIRNTFTRDHGLANEYVFAIGIDPEGTKWFGTNAGGMSSYKDGTWNTYFPLHGLADYWIYAFANHPDGYLWIGTWAGANRLDLSTGEFKTYVEELINEWVYGIAVDRSGRIWFGTEGGISRFDREEWVSWDHEDGIGAKNPGGLPASTNTGLGTRSRHDLGVLAGGLPTYNPNYVFSIIVDQDDNIWAGTWGGGVSHRVNGEWQNYTTSDGLAGNIVYSMLQDSKGVFWFGTDQGVTRYDGNNWLTIGVAEGLKNKDVYALAEDATGDIWAGTRAGVTHISSN